MLGDPFRRRSSSLPVAGETCDLELVLVGAPSATSVECAPCSI